MVVSSKPPTLDDPTGLPQVELDQAPPDPAPAHEVYGTSRHIRALISERGDGLFSVEFERLMPGDPEHCEPSYWSPLHRPKTVVDTFERARAIALEVLAGEAEAGGDRD